MIKIGIFVECDVCHGEAYVPMGIDVDSRGKNFIRYCPCPSCGGSGMKHKVISLSEFLKLAEKEKCLHEHIVTQGGIHFDAGDVWDDEHDVCCDCGKVIR